MEWIEARALKSSFLSETTQQVFVDDVYGVNSINGVVSYDDFSVDVFLDLSNEDFKDVFVGEESEEEKETLSVSSSQDTSTTFSGAGDSGCLSAGELAVPVDDLEDLEWFSQLVDDSVSELSLLCPKVDNQFELVSRPAVQISELPVLCFPTPVPVKARSKRSRPSGRVWSYDSSSLTESSSTTSSCGSSPISVLIFPNPVQGDGVVKPPAKKQRKRPKAEAGSETNGSPSQRRCSHCQVQKTPQWRTGPHGAKTLCNACGVRYKSGRLFPEYRPACSPTFSSDVHSNSHRKVLEMRQKKVVTGDESGLTSIV